MNETNGIGLKLDFVALTKVRDQDYIQNVIRKNVNVMLARPLTLLKVRSWLCLQDGRFGVTAYAAYRVTKIFPDWI